MKEDCFNEHTETVDNALSFPVQEGYHSGSQKKEREADGLYPRYCRPVLLETICRDHPEIFRLEKWQRLNQVKSSLGCMTK